MQSLIRPGWATHHAGDALSRLAGNLPMLDMQLLLLQCNPPETSLQQVEQQGNGGT